MKYKDIEIDIASTKTIEGAVTIPLPDGGMVIVPEQNATPEELKLIQQNKEDVALRPIIVEKPPVIVPSPSLEERVAALEETIKTIITGTLPIQKIY